MWARGCVGSARGCSCAFLGVANEGTPSLLRASGQQVLGKPGQSTDPELGVRRPHRERPALPGSESRQERLPQLPGTGAGRARPRLPVPAAQCPGWSPRRASFPGPGRGAGRWARRAVDLGRGLGLLGEAGALDSRRELGRRSWRKPKPNKHAARFPLPRGAGLNRGLLGSQLPVQLFAGDLWARRARTAGGQLGRELLGFRRSTGGHPFPPTGEHPRERPGAALCLGRRGRMERGFNLGAPGGSNREDPFQQTLPACCGVRVSAPASRGLGPSWAHLSPWRGRLPPSRRPPAAGAPRGWCFWVPGCIRERGGHWRRQREQRAVLEFVHWDALRSRVGEKWAGRRRRPLPEPPPPPRRKAGGSSRRENEVRLDFERLEEDGARTPSVF